MSESDRLAQAMRSLRERPGARAQLPMNSRRHEEILGEMMRQIPFQELADGNSAGTHPLAALTTRDTSDPSIALLDAWAAACDVLDFYNERVACEGYLDTAYQSRSIRHLVRPLGRQPSPGAAAAVTLAFTVEVTEESPAVTRIPAGTPVQSIPGQNELPQTFETREDFVARSDWNELRLDCRPVLTEQSFRFDSTQTPQCTTRFFLKGRAVKVKPGDLLLVTESAGNSAANWAVLIVRSVRYEAAEGRTVVEWEPRDVFAPLASTNIDKPCVYSFGRELGLFGRSAADWSKLPDDVKATCGASWNAWECLDGPSMTSSGRLPCRGLPPAELRDLTIDSSGFLYAATSRGVFRSATVFNYAAARAQGVDWIDATGTLPNKDVHSCIATPNGVFVGTTYGGLFRQVKPGDWEAFGPLKYDDPTPKSPVVATVRALSLAPPTFLVARSGEQSFNLRFDEPARGYSIATSNSPLVAPPPPTSRRVLDVGNNTYVAFVPRPFQGFNESDWPNFTLGEWLPLSGAVSDLAPGEWMLAVDESKPTLPASGGAPAPPPRADPLRFRPMRVAQTRIESRDEFGLRGEVTFLATDEPSFDRVGRRSFAALDRRRTRVLLKSERLELAELAQPRATNLTKNRLGLADPASDLARGQSLLIRGREVDDAKSSRREVCEVGVVEQVADGGREIVLRDVLQYSYEPDSVRINANVVRATHGETVEQEVLGSGDSLATFQRFRLRRPPLTYVLDEKTGTLVSTLRIEVGGVRWSETPTFVGQGPESRCYVVTHDDEGNTIVTFGDGRTGARLPVGVENVIATYRTGIGSAGNVRAGQLTVLLSPPHKVDAVVNPLPATGGVAPEQGDDLRRSGPEFVARPRGVICLADYQRLAYEFPEVTHARADRDPDGSIVVTVGSMAAETMDSQRLKALENRLRTLHPFQRVRVANCVKRRFALVAALDIDADRNWSDVERDARRALNATFGEAQCDFDGEVLASEIIALLHRVPGVSGVRLSEPDDQVATSRDELLFLGESPDACRLSPCQLSPRTARGEVRT